MATKRLNYVEIWNDHQKGMTKEEIAKKYKCTSEVVRRVLVMGSAFAIPSERRRASTHTSRAN